MVFKQRAREIRMTLNFKNLGMSASERRAEASRIVTIVEDSLDRMTPAESRFVEQMGDDFAPVSEAQLIWLRGIKDKYE